MQNAWGEPETFGSGGTGAVCPAIVSVPFVKDHAGATLPFNGPHDGSARDPRAEEEIKRRAREPLTFVRRD